MRFLEKAFPAAIITLLILAAGTFGAPATSHALSPTLQKTLEKTAAMVPSVSSLLPQSDNSIQMPVADQTQPMMPTASSPDTPTPTSTDTATSSPTSIQPSSSNTPMADQATASPSPTTSNPGTINVNHSSFSNNVARSSFSNVSVGTAPVATVSIVNQSNLHHAPATGIRASTIYGSTYPAYQLSKTASNKLLDVSRVATVIGLVVLFGAILYGLLRKRVYAYQKVSRK